VLQAFGSNPATAANLLGMLSNSPAAAPAPLSSAAPDNPQPDADPATVQAGGQPVVGADPQAPSATLDPDQARAQALAAAQQPGALQGVDLAGTARQLNAAANPSAANGATPTPARAATPTPANAATPTPANGATATPPKAATQTPPKVPPPASATTQPGATPHEGEPPDPPPLAIHTGNPQVDSKFGAALDARVTPSQRARIESELEDDPSLKGKDKSSPEYKKAYNKAFVAQQLKNREALREWIKQILEILARQGETIANYAHNG
jgi:hypothetical protein